MFVSIPEENLKYLKLYRYNAEDNSIISRLILRKWWNFFVTFFPSFFSPNLITLLGLMFNVFNFFLTLFYELILQRNLPRCFYLLYAFGIFMYQTFDGCDGCHARRLGVGSALGEFFDHSIDSINTIFGYYIFANVIKLNYSHLFLISFYGTITNFFLSTWEEYHTQKMFLSFFNGPVEGILIIIIIFLVSYYVENDFWNKNELKINLKFLLKTCKIVVSYRDLIVYFGIAFVLLNLFFSIKNVLNFYLKKSNNASSLKKTSLLGINNFVLYLISVFVYITLFPIALKKFGLTLFLSIGLTNSYTVGTIIVSHLTKLNYPKTNILMLCPIFQTILNYFLLHFLKLDVIKSTFIVNLLFFIISLGIYTLFILNTMSQMSKYLNIPIFIFDKDLKKLSQSKKSI